MSRDDVHRFIIAYDITDDLRRAKVAKLLESYGDRAQFSLFILDIKPARMVRLRTALQTRLEAEDSVLITNLGPLTQRWHHTDRVHRPSPSNHRRQPDDLLNPREPFTGTGAQHEGFAR